MKELPLWLTRELSSRHFLEHHTPRAFRQKELSKLKAGAPPLPSLPDRTNLRSTRSALQTAGGARGRGATRDSAEPRLSRAAPSSRAAIAAKRGVADASLVAARTLDPREKQSAQP